MKTKVKENAPQVKTLLYVGTSEQIAKLAPVKGLNPPIFLTDVYPGFFCSEACQNIERWGIISVNLGKLNTEMMAPSPFFIKKSSKIKDVSKLTDKILVYKNKWRKSLQESGVCFYTAYIPPSSIEKVMIYSKENKTINGIISDLPNPHSVMPSEHKSLYKRTLGLTKWLNGEEVNYNEISNREANSKVLSDIDDNLHNRFGLDIYYIRTEEKIRKAAKKSGINNGN